MLTGPDVSRHQGPINWQAVRDAGHTFAFTKLTDGTSYPYVGYGATQLAKMRQVGLWSGTYHWLQPGNGAAQARYYVDNLNATGGVNGVLTAVDVEDDNSGSSNPTNTLYEFAGEFARLTGGHPLIVYSGQWFWVGHMGNPGGAHLGPLWHSEYETSQAEIDDGPELDNYGGWPGAKFWQYTSSGSCPGVSGNVDLNIFYGGLAELTALTGQQEAPDMTPEESAALFQVRNLLAGSSGDRIGDLWNQAGGSEPTVNKVLAQLTTANDGRLGEIWSALQQVLAQTDVSETEIAAQVLAVLTPEAIAGALPPTIATEVADLLHARLAS